MTTKHISDLDQLANILRHGIAELRGQLEILVEGNKQSNERFLTWLEDHDYRLGVVEGAVVRITQRVERLEKPKTKKRKGTI